MQEKRMLLAGLSIYRGILDDPVIKDLAGLLDLLAYDQVDPVAAVNAAHQFIYALAEHGCSYKNHLLQLILHDENAFSRRAETEEFSSINPVLAETVSRDLELLQQLYHLDWRMEKLIKADSSLGQISALMMGASQSDWAAGVVLAGAADWNKEVETLYHHYHTYGSGIISRYYALRWENPGKQLAGIPCPDPVGLSDLVGYNSQKQQICRNTEQFLQGYPANNVLLYGSRGTGKSTMVKALLNQYRDQGLRLVEVASENLESLPEVISILRQHALKYILFIDDLSFEDYETRYKGLKAVMEGSLDARPDNVLLYATSNRRHLIREYHSDRNEQDEEIHTWDTMQEKLSLSDRFGLTITFESPSQQLYLNIVEKLVQDRGMDIDPEMLRRRALEWERAHHGPSGRTARQFVDSLGDGNSLQTMRN